MITFRKGQKSPVRTPDSLTTDDTVEALLAISEGPIKGLVGGAQNFFLDDTPLVNDSGEANFRQFALDIWEGSEAGHVVDLYLGGVSSPLPVNQGLSSNVAVVRQGLQRNITAIDVRLVVTQLLKSNEKGTFKNDLKVRIEIKRQSEATWRPAWFQTVVLDYQQTSVPGQTQYEGGRQYDTFSFEQDFPFWVNEGAPTDPPPAYSIGSQPPRYLDSSTTDGIYTWNSGLGWVREPQITPTGGVTSDGRVYSVTPTAPTSADAGDLWSPGAGELYIFNGHVWVTPGEFYSPPVSLNSSGVWQINEKITSQTSRDLRIFVEAVDELYQIRVTKLSPNSTEQEFTEVTWESLQEIRRGPIAFEGVSTARIIGRASDQFTGFPNFSGVYEGRIVKVPTNYNPVARTYAGVWDGTYKMAYTNNTAWVLLDFVENTTYGLSSVYPHTVNKWKFYEFGQWCDEPIEKPDDTTRPRWTFNEYLTEQRDAEELAQYIAGSAGARIIEDGNGYVDLIIDKDEPAVMLFTPENVGEDGFSYSRTDVLTRPNEIIVEFVNPNLDWRPDKLILRDEDAIEEYGRITDNFIAVGCTDEDEAMARARRRYISSQTEVEMVTFTTNRQGKYLEPWNIILVADPKMGRGVTGRISTQVSPNTITFREAVNLEAGILYRITFTLPSLETVTCNVTSPAGQQQMLTFTPALPGLPEHAPFVVQAEDVIGLPKPYRIMDLEDTDGTGEVIQITALEVNRGKQAYIDNGVRLDPIDYDRYQLEKTDPPSNPRVEVVDASTWALRIIWDRSPTPAVRSYIVDHYFNDSLVATYNAILTELEIPSAPSGANFFTIRAVGLTGRESRSVSVGYNTGGVARTLPQVKNLRVVAGTIGGAHNTNPPVIQWDVHDTFKEFKNYHLAVGPPGDEPTGGVDVGTALSWELPRQTLRSRKVAVWTVDLFGQKSQPVTLTITNPAPAAPTLQIDAKATGTSVTVSQPVDADYVETLVWVSQSSSFDPTAAEPTYRASQTSFYLNLLPGFTYYVWAAHSDGLPGPYNLSSRQTVVVPSRLSELIELPNLDDIELPNIDDLERGLEEALKSILQLGLDMSDVESAIRKVISIQGRPVGAVVEEVIEQTNYSVRALSLLGVVGENGGAFILDEDLVKFDNGRSLAQRLSDMTAYTDLGLAQVVQQTTASVNALRSEVQTAYVSRTLFDQTETAIYELITQTSDDLEAEIAQQYLTKTEFDASETAIYSAITQSSDALGSYVDDTFLTITSFNTARTTISNDISASATAVLSQVSKDYTTIATFDTQIAGLSDQITVSSDATRSYVDSNFLTRAQTESSYATITFVNQVQASINGLTTSLIGLRTNTNGRIAGFTIYNNGEQSDFDVEADKFRIWSGSLGVPAFSVINGSVYVAQDRVATESMVANAVTEAGVAFTGASMSLSGTTQVTIQSLSFNCKGRPVLVRGNFYMTCWHPASGGFSVVVRILRNGVAIFEIPIEAINGDQITGWQTPEVEDNPGSGLHNYSITVQLSRDDGFQIQTVQSRLIRAQEFKR